LKGGTKEGKESGGLVGEEEKSEDVSRSGGWGVRGRESPGAKKCSKREKGVTKKQQERTPREGGKLRKTKNGQRRRGFGGRGREKGVLSRTVQKGPDKQGPWRSTNNQHAYGYVVEGRHEECEEQIVRRRATWRYEKEEGGGVIHHDLEGNGRRGLEDLRSKWIGNCLQLGGTCNKGPGEKNGKGGGTIKFKEESGERNLGMDRPAVLKCLKEVLGGHPIMS